MKPLHYRDDDSTSGIVLGAIVGALAGFAAGMYMAQHAGTTDADKLKGERADAEPVHERIRSAHGESDEDVEDELDDDFEDTDDDEFEEYDVTLEERVLEAFRNDPILSARAVDIGSLRTGVIELAGVVETAQEAQHAVTIARGVPGVETVVNRIVTGLHEPRYNEASHDGRRRHTSAHDVERPVGDARVMRGDMAAKPNQPDEAVRGDQPPFEGEQTL
jgi:hypothetical protein